ncbi:hypothetical protein PNOK_0968100 [Pyrrhoderma noxium]|uniref:Hydrophobin n=1 Tax=Pyrrhoderma noxium TaxID=2282107 RepID=A0A286U4V6_9AGAM|nr:hypothetical protein PNOK_0968100 [Pyrrhoderma noxium]
MALSELTPQSLAAQDGVNPLVCVLELSTVQCCETIEPLSLVVDLLKGVLGLLGIPLPSLDTLVALNCQPSFLGIGCSHEVLCCSLVLPNLDIGVNCQPVSTLF